MKFDPKQPYGLIMNHPWARYEQGGILFDYEGKRADDEIIKADQVAELEELEEAETPVNNNLRDFAYANAEAFLKNILAEGPLARSSIFREASHNNQNWEKVKTAFADLGGEVSTRKNVIHWKLKTE